MKQLPLAIAVDAAPSFDTFLPGRSTLAVAQLRVLVERAETAPPVYLWGPAGSGKTHLLRATAQACRERGRQTAGFDAQTPLPWTLDGGGSLLVLDQCDAFDPERQHAAFALFVEAATLGSQVLAAGRLPPVDLPLREDLRTRLGWGHVIAVEPLPEADVRAALRREADRRGLMLSDELMDYLLNRFARDLKHLTGQLDALDAYALVHKRALSVPLFKQMLAESAGTHTT